MPELPNVLDELLGIPTVAVGGTAVTPRRTTLDFAAGLDTEIVGESDPDTGAVRITITAAGNGATVRPARLAATGNVADLALASPTVDGETAVDGDRILLPLQTDPIENGVYVAAIIVGGPNDGLMTLTRAADMAAGSSVAPGLSVAVQEGTYWPGSTWTLTGSGALTVGTDALRFVPDETRIDARKRFGVRADGTTDDTAAIRAAAMAGAAYGIKVALPAGVIKITETLDWRHDGVTNYAALDISGCMPSALPDYGIQQTILEWHGSTNDPMIQVTRGTKLQGFLMRVAAGKSTVAAIDWDQHENHGAAKGSRIIVQHVSILGDLSGVGTYGTIDYGIAVGRNAYRLNEITQVGSGPALTFTGTASALLNILIEITLGGARGTAEFRWSDDNGLTWEATGVTTPDAPNTIALGTTGITAVFPTGTYMLATTYAFSTGVTNLEFGEFDDVSISHCETAQFSIRSPTGQSKSHVFYDCQFGPGDLGIELVTGSYLWYGGGFVTLARCVDVVGAGPSDWIKITDVQTERCGRLIDFTRGYSAAGVGARIIGGRFSLTDGFVLNNGAGFIKWSTPGPLIVANTLWENAGLANPSEVCIALENTVEPRLISFGNTYLNANFVKAYALGEYSSFGDDYAPDGVTPRTKLPNTSNARCDTNGPMSPGETRIDGEVSIENGTSYTLSDAFETTDAATPHDTTLVAAVPTGAHGVYDVTVWASGANQTTGAVCLLCKRLVVSVSDDGSCTARVDNVDVGDQYDGITVGGLALSHAGTPAAIVATVTGKIGTDILWSLKADVLTHLVAHELGH